MKELRKRVNGLIAILLAVCLSLEMSGEQVAAATTIEFGYYSNIDLSKIESYTPESLQLSEMGDVMKETTSGGSFVIDKENSASGITDYFSFSPGTAEDGTTIYYTLATLNKALPVDYKAIQISGSSPLQNSEGAYINSSSGRVYSITLQWVPAETYTLNYDLNGGTGTAIASRKQQWEKAYSLENPSDWTKKGYAFNGWSFSSDRSGTTYLAGREITLPNDEITTVNDGQELTLYAVWNPYAYTAMFNPGSVGQEIPAGDMMGKMESTSDQAISLPECTYTLPNYHFAGWKYNGASNDGIADPTDENVGTIYPAGSKFEYLPGYDNETIQFEAQWNPNTVSISYDANGGTGTMAGATYTYDGSIFAYLLPGADGSLSKDGYRFIGWCENADGSSEIMSEGDQYSLDFSKGNQDITLYAIWEPNAYSIRFNGNGGTGEMANQAGISSEPTILNPNQFTSIDQMFAGWSTTGTGTVQYVDRASFDYKASTNNQVVDLFAIWTKLYKLAFDANGGGGNMDTLLNGMDGIGQTLPECAFTKEGFVFKGWATNPYTLTAEYQPGDSFTYSPQTAGETVTLYAIWEAEGANAADRIQVGLGTVYLTAGQEYFFGEDGVYKVDGDPTAYPMNTIFYVPVSGNYTISVQ